MGASFLYDGVTFAFGSQTDNYIPVTVTLTKGAVAIETDTVYLAFISTDRAIDSMDWNPSSVLEVGDATGFAKMGIGSETGGVFTYGVHYNSADPATIYLVYPSYDAEGEGEETIYINIIMPDGSVVKSIGHTWTYVED